MIKDKWVIFDLDGTLADIEGRRKMAMKSNGKMDWDIFFASRILLDPIRCEESYNQDRIYPNPLGGSETPYESF